MSEELTLGEIAERNRDAMALCNELIAEKDLQIVKLRRKNRAQQVRIKNLQERVAQYQREASGG